MSPSSEPPPLMTESQISQIVRGCFYGFLLSALAFGALVMLYVQLTQVLLLHPSRDRTFWSIVGYSFALLPLTVASFVGQVRFSEIVFTLYGEYPGGGIGFLFAHASPWCDILNQISGVIIPCFADLLMFYRLVVLWGRQWKILIPLGLLWILRIGLSIPILISKMKPPNNRNFKSDFVYEVALSAVFVTLNASFTGLIFSRLFSMRHKADRVLGRLQATLYNSYTTLFVESGALFTLWAVASLIARSKDTWVQNAFADPYKYILIITRMLIILRMAQSRAWTAEIINASQDGILDWDVSSSTSVELNMRTSDKQANDFNKYTKTSITT